MIVTVRSFGCVKNITLVSMRLQFVSVESVQWVLRGLKRDGMCPNERAVQSRIKEAFGVKVNQGVWEMVMREVERVKAAELNGEGVEEARGQIAMLKIPQQGVVFEY